MSRRRSPVSLVLPTAATLALLAATGAVLSFSPEAPTAPPDPGTPSVGGVVVDDRGVPIRGATVWVDKSRIETGSDGRFLAAHDGAAVVTASAPGRLPRTVSLGVGEQGRIALTGQAAQTVSLRFGGDVMLGRRYYAGSANTSPMLKKNATSNAIANVLAGVRPFLDDADLSVVNLETSLVDDPRAKVSGKRPGSLHPTKDLVITSSTQVAKALADSGVDVVSLSNDHSFDGLDAGLASTMKALDEAGVRHYGAGRTADEAWRPAVVEVKGQRIAFVGCTTVDGRSQPISYVAERGHGGAAACDPARLDAAVRAARSQAAYVVVSIHGGVEYRRSQTAAVRGLAKVAHAAGARLVVGSHPHVVGGMVHQGANLFIESMGNLAFDQEIWSTLPSYLARVDVRAGATVATDIDPVVLDDYRPRPVTGTLATSIGRIAAGWVEGDARLEPHAARVPLGLPATGGAAVPAASQTSTVRLQTSEVRRLGAGWWLAPAPDLRTRVQAGTDQLMGTGAFEPDVVGAAPAPLWSLGKFGRITPEASCAQDGGGGLTLARTPLSEEQAVATTRHRVAAAQGQALTVSAKVRYAAPGSRLEVHWYRDFSGRSSSTSRFDIPTGSWDRGACQKLRFDVVVPRKAVAAQVFVVLDPPHGGQTVRRLALDDLMLVDWAPKGRSGRRYDVIGALTAGGVSLGHDSPDGSGSRAAPLEP